MGEVIDLSEYRELQGPLKIRETICLLCLHRWFAVFPVGLTLKKMECPGCGEQGGVIDTGECLEEIGDVVIKYT